MKELEKELGYVFKDESLLATALTHSSYANENRGSGQCNERLEFLGDSILGMTVAERLYRVLPDAPEGDMTRIRAELVCEQSLHEVSLRLGLGNFLRLGRGEELNGGRTRPSILADAVEAVLAAIYLDGGRESADGFVNKYVLSKLRSAEKGQTEDYKTALQEKVQTNGASRLEYVITGESGPDHSKRFEAEVRLNGERAGAGAGKSKKEAEQAAAKDALEALK